METRENRYQKHRKVAIKKQPVIKKYEPQKKKKTKKVTKPVSKKVEKISDKVSKVPKKTKKIRIKFKNVFLVLILFALVFGISYSVWKLPITNIYVEGNTYLSDQQIIELSGLSDYPSFLSTFGNGISTRLESESLIASVKVKRGFRTVTLKIDENRPLYFYQTKKHTILEDKEEVDISFQVPTLINYVPDTVYDDFHKKMSGVEMDVLRRISEIKYAPDEVDTGRFLLSMNDGNYVYLTLTKWSVINNYVNIIKEFPNQKGILYLNAGNSFEVLEK